MKDEGALTVAEADRLAVVLAVAERRLAQKEAAARLGLSARQVRRLAKRYRERYADFGPTLAAEKLAREWTGTRESKGTFLR